MSVLNNSLLLGADAGATGYQISRSLRFNSSDSAYCSRVPASAGNRKTWTWAAWVKRSGTTTSWLPLLQAYDGSSRDEANYLQLVIYSDQVGIATDTVWLRRSQAVYRDYSAWYHIVCAFDTTQATAANRVKLYVNGIEITAYAASSDPTLNSDYGVNRAVAHQIGQRYGGEHFSGYLADIHFIDGQALTPSSFTTTDATTGQLIPKAYTGSYGTNGFKLDFSNNATAAALGTDTSGNGNTWTVNNLSVTAGAGNDSLVDSPSNYGTDTGVGGEVRGNYCVLNPLAKSSQTNINLANGNLEASNSTSSGQGRVDGTIAVSSGKWYFEATLTGTNGHGEVGFIKTNTPLAYGIGFYSGGYSYTEDGFAFHANSATSYGTTYTQNDVIGVALDLDAGTLAFYKNGVSQGTAFTGLSGEFYPSVGTKASFVPFGWIANFGQRPFAYTAPSGFKALCTQNLGSPLIAQPSTVMDVVLYSGNNSTQTIPLNFNPDFIWLKCRNGARSHRLIDTVRGLQYQLWSDLTTGGNTYDATSYPSSVTSTSSTGFVVDNSGSDQYNTSGETYVAWCWDAGSSTVSNTQGSITSSVRANASAGFSVVSYVSNGTNGTSVGHGLNVKPALVIQKDRTSASDWLVLTQLIDGSNDYLLLNSTAAAGTAAAGMTSTTFGSWDRTNGNNMIAYCFAPVSGYSSFGSYTGNGSASDNTFIYTGMRPRFVLLKRSDSTGNWVIWDAVRNSYNVANSIILPNSSAAEYSPDAKIDILSNGFKIRDNSSDSGTNGATYVYAAFAEAPFQTARAR